jgi:glutamate synthase domain-containing protein 3
MTTEQATSLKATLESMFEHIAQKESIVEDLEQIERLQQEFASTVPAQLRHYLQRRSYTKALDFLKDDFVADSA